MTTLERTLATVLDAIEHATAAKDALALVTLLRRKQAICAALGAPEHAWHDPTDRTPDCLAAPGEVSKEAMPLVA